ncbi:MAG: hypothetical protein GKR89_07525 [Candidatus Latescibacteria bacterium]|nr:hypothetical protein [Candidatus Latescibacterota bacterium]
MPVLKSGDKHPPWCELEYFEVRHLPVGENGEFVRRAQVEKLIVGAGHCRLRVGSKEVDAAQGANLDLTGPGSFQVLAVDEAATLVHMCGRWGEETGGSGIFTGVNSDQPQDKGDPVSYEKQTNFDCHFHDCDEYWIVFEGRARAVSESRVYEVGPGDCLATGMGHHHDLPLVHEPLRAVYFETTMEEAKRRGHLWDHTHGTAQPQAERV